MSSAPEAAVQRVVVGLRARVFELGSIVVALLLWELLIVSGILTSGVIPRPSVIIVTTAALLSDGTFLNHTWVTIYRTCLASLLAVVPGILLGLSMGWNERVRAALYPLLGGIYPLPKVALLPLLMLIFGIGETSMILTAALAAVFLILLNAMHGVQEVSDIYLEAAADNDVDSTYRYFREILIPATLPRIITGLRLTLTTALVVVISVEFITGNQGLGYFIWISWTTYVLPNMYAGFVVAGVLGMVITYGLEYLGNYLVPWREPTMN